MPQHSYAPVGQSAAGAELRERGSLKGANSSATLPELKVHHVADDDWPTHELLFGSKLNALLVMVPVAALSTNQVLVSAIPKPNPDPNPDPTLTLILTQTLTFVAALLALCPLAERLGFVTEQLALHTNATVGGLLNATFGNATEMIVCIFAIRSGLLRVVQLSLLGSVLSNLLLVLGTAFFLGGLRHKVQTFSIDSVKANTSLLMLGMITLLMPNLLDSTNSMLDSDDALRLSRFCSVVLLVVYAAFLVFQLKTHRFLFEPDSPQSPPAAAGSRGGGGGGSSTRATAPEQGFLNDQGLYSTAPAAEAGNDDEDGDDDGDDDEEEVLGFRGSIFWLAFLTLWIAWLSDLVVDTIEVAAEALQLPVAFVSTILLPIVGNAAEHASAVIFAMKNKMELSIGVAVGSATQITLFVIPFCVVAAGAVGAPLSLDFLPFETGVFVFSVLGATTIMADGRSNWLKGLVLVAAYVVLAAAFFFHEDPPGVNGATWDNKDLLPGGAGSQRSADDDDGPDDD